MWLNKLMCVLILATTATNVESYYESESTTWANVKCNLGEPQIKYQNRYFEVDEALNISDDVWIGYIYAKIPLLLLGCASLQSENVVNVTAIGDCFTICRSEKIGIKRLGQESGLLCICVMVNFETNVPISRGGDQRSLCNDFYEIYTMIFNASNIVGSDNELDGDCLTYFYPHFKWQPCLRTDPIRSMCSNSTFTDLKATATIKDVLSNKWLAGNKLCLTEGLHPSFERSITNAGFSYSQEQNYWTGIFRENVLIKLSSKDFYSRFLTDSPVFANKSSRILWVAGKGDKYSALCVTRSESTSSQTETSKDTTEVTPSITPSTDYEISVPLTKVTTPDVTTTEGFKESTTLGIGIGVSIVIMILVGGAIIIVVLKRRGLLHFNQKSANDTPLGDEQAFKNSTTYGKRDGDNVAHHNYFILEKCAQSNSNTAEVNNDANEANMDDDYYTIHDPEEPYEHVTDESSDYDHATNAFTSGPDANKPENVYNKLKIDRSGGRVVQKSEDDYDTTKAIITNGKDDVSDYNNIPRTVNTAGATGNYLRGDQGEYDSIRSMELKVIQSDESDYAHVNTDQIR